MAAIVAVGVGLRVVAQSVEVAVSALASHKLSVPVNLRRISFFSASTTSVNTAAVIRNTVVKTAAEIMIISMLTKFL